MWLWLLVFVSVVALWAFSKTIHRKKPYRVETTPVKGILRPINFIFDAIRGTTGIALFKIKEKDFIKQAEAIVKQTDTELFGSQEEYLKGLKLFLSAPDQKIMSASGILLLNGLIQALINTRRRTIRYIQANQDTIIHSRLDKPIIISGLPRTGSTMLYNLLSCDPKARAPRFFEISQMANPTPPVSSQKERDEDARIKQVMRRFAETEKNYPNLWTEAGKSHRSHPNEIEEDLLVLLQSFIMQLHVPLAHDGYREWFEDSSNKQFAYTYHRLFFQMLNSAWKPESHWVLKAPIHSMYLETLQEQYPDARFVITHRKPLSVVPSWARLLESYLNWSFLPYAGDRVKFGKYISDSLVLCAERVMEWESKNDKNIYFDVVYSDMVKDPIATVENIYSHFGLEVTEEFRENMKTWIQQNRQGKYGRREYSLADYKLSESYIENEFKSYISRYFG